MSKFSSKNAEIESLRIQQTLAEIEGDEDQAEIVRLKRINVVLVDALNGLLAHLWDGRKRNVKEDYSLMVAEVEAQDAIRRAEISQVVEKQPDPLLESLFLGDE